MHAKKYSIIYVIECAGYTGGMQHSYREITAVVVMPQKSDEYIL